MAEHECFWDMRARAYKNHNARKMLGDPLWSHLE